MYILAYILKHTKTCIYNMIYICYIHIIYYIYYNIYIYIYVLVHKYTINNKNYIIYYM